MAIKSKIKCEHCDFPRHKIELRKLDLRIVWNLPSKPASKRTVVVDATPRQIFEHPQDQTYATALQNHLDAGFLLFCLRQLPTHTRHALLGPVDPSCFLLMNLLVPPSIVRPYTSQGKRVGLNELTVKLNEIVVANLTLYNQTDPVWYQFIHKLLHKHFDCSRFPPDWIWFETWMEHHQIRPDVIRTVFEYAVDWTQWSSEQSQTWYIQQYVHYWMDMKTQIISTKWMEQYMLLKFYGCIYFDNGRRLHKPDKKTVRTNPYSKGIGERIKGKYGRFRWNLLGKRVDQCARTVIVPESFLDIDELSVPLFIAKQLTISETAQMYNRAKLQQLIIQGASTWPGANSLVKKATNSTIELELLSVMERKTLAAHIELGDIVMRHLQDGDICLFNRQPSLHRSSMMGHRIRVLSNGKGFGLHECVTSTYNADFDGDEMNFFVVQIFEARAEVQEFMMVEHQMYNHQNLGLAFGMKQNPLLVLALLSSLDQWYSREDSMQWIQWWTDSPLALPEPAIVKPIPMWSSRQIVSMIFPPTFSYHRLDVVIDQGEWITGKFDKNHLGTGEGQLFHALLHQMGCQTTKRIFSDLHKFSSDWLLHNGFSCGLSDCFHANETAYSKRTHILDKASETIHRHGAGSSEANITQFLNTLPSFTQPTAHSENRILAMVSSGSKGSMDHFRQIMCMLGQQNNFDGKRFMNPTHPILQKEQTPKYHGLVGKSYLEGLDAHDFFLHCAAGRKGLVDTAVSTAATGYSQRRLIKTFESIFVTWDGYVRTTSQTIINTSYGICNFDVRWLRPYTLQSQLPDFPELWTKLQPSHLDRALTQQLFFGQNIKQSLTKHVHQSNWQMTPIKIEIPFVIEYSWTQFIAMHPDDPNPEDVNLRDMLQPLLKIPKYLIFCVLMADWFASRPLRQDFVRHAKQLYDARFVASGEAVGTVAAESVSEPATQMTLNTFHFAGTAKQNVTNGIPRLRELLFVKENVKTPLIYAHLLRNLHVPVPELHQICETLVQRTFSYFIKQSTIETNHLILEFHHNRLIQCQLTPFSLCAYLRHQLADWEIKINRQPITIHTTCSFVTHASSRVVLQIQLDPCPSNAMSSLLQWMKVDWIVSGVAGVDSAHLYQVSDDHLMSVCGSNDMSLIDLWEVFPIDWHRTFSNRVTEIQSVLGIDAAKYVLFKEMKTCMSLEGTMVHDTHLRLIVDVMTCTGKLLPTDRNGLVELMPENILTRASFEQNMNVLCQAAMLHQEQEMTGVSESIMVGSDLIIGTGASKMIPIDAQQVDGHLSTRVYVTTEACNDYVDFPPTDTPMSEMEWQPYFDLMQTIRTQCVDKCLQYIQSIRQRTPTPVTSSDDTYLSRKRKQNDLVPTDYRPSSPILVPYNSSYHGQHDSSYNENVSMDVDDDDDSSNAIPLNVGDNPSNKSAGNNPSNDVDELTVESLVSCMRSLPPRPETSISEALTLMQSLVSKQTAVSTLSALSTLSDLSSSLSSL
jgi:DNA-directed RNA polymerase beta' subunit